MQWQRKQRGYNVVLAAGTADGMPQTVHVKTKSIMWHPQEAAKKMLFLSGTDVTRCLAPWLS